MDDQTPIGVRGPDPPPEPARAEPIAGELITETLDYDGGRQVTVYVPPGFSEAVVFAGDGQLISQWCGILEAADVTALRDAGAGRGYARARRVTRRRTVARRIPADGGVGVSEVVTHTNRL